MDARKEIRALSADCAADNHTKCKCRVLAKLKHVTIICNCPCHVVSAQMPLPLAS